MLHEAAPDHVDLEAGGHRRRFSVHAEPTGAVHVNCDAGQLSLVEQPRHPRIEDVAAAGSLASPMPGAVWKVLAAAGDDVTKGQPLLIIEAMKMEHEIVAPVDGPLEELRVAEGDQVEAGTILAVIGEVGRWLTTRRCSTRSKARSPRSPWTTRTPATRSATRRLTG